jgi:ATP-binding cassette subfamily C (CFTR/MRP) protein 1
MMFCIQRWLNLVLDLLVAGLAVMSIILAVHLRGTTSGGQIGIALTAVMGFNQLLLRLVDTWTLVETSLAAISRLKSFEAEVVSEDRPDEDVIPPESWPEEGGIEFRNVCASYGYVLHASPPELARLWY